MATFYTNISAKAYADALSVGLFGAAASQNVENAAAVAMGIPPSQLASTIPTNLQVWNAGIALAQSPLFAAKYPGSAVDAGFFTNLNTALTGSTFLMASELAAFQAVATTYGLNKAQAATYFVAVVLSTDPSSLGLSTAANPGNPGGLSDYQTYLNQFNAATNRTIVSGNFATQSVGASNLNYPVVGPATNAGYLGGVNAESGVNNLTASVVTAENSIATAAAANDPTLIPNVPQPGTTYTLTTGVDAPGLGAFAFGSPSGNSQVVGSYNFGASTTFNPGDQILATGTNNTLNLSDGGTNVGTQDITAIAATVSGVQTANVSSSQGVTFNSVTGYDKFTGLTQLTVNNAGATTLTVAGTTNVTEINSAQVATAIAVDGGNNVSVTSNAGTTGTITLGATTAIGGNVTINTSQNIAAAGTGGAIAVTGGKVVSVTSTTSGNAGNTTATLGAIGVTGTANTTSVSVVQSAGATAAAAVANVANTSSAVAAVAGITNSAVTIADANAGSATARATITAVTLQNYGASTISSNALNTLTLSATGSLASGTLGLTSGLASGNPTTMALNLGGGSLGVITDNSNQLATWNVSLTADTTLGGITDTAARTLSLAGTGVLTLTATNAALTSITNTSTAAGLNANVSGVAGITSLNFSTTSAKNTITLNAASQAYTGGSGIDQVTIGADALRAISGGAGTADVLVLTATAATYTANSYTTNISGFETLRVTNAAGGTYDMSNWTGYTRVQNGGANNTFSNVAANTGLDIYKLANTTTVYTLAGTNGAASTVNLGLIGTTVTAANGGGTAGFTTTAITLQDANAVGVGTVNILSDASVFQGLHTITTLTDTALANLNVTGTGSLSIGAAATTSTSLTISDNGTGTSATADGIVTLTSTGDVLGNLSYSGSHAYTIGTLADNVNNITITNANTGTSGVLTIGTHTNTATAAGSLTLTGAIAYTGTSASTGAFTVSGATDNQNVNWQVSAVGNAGVKTVTLGNGANVVMTGAAADTITLGVGTDLVRAGAGADKVTFGLAHAGSDIFQWATAAGAGGGESGTFATPGSNSIDTTNFDKYTGLKVGDVASVGTTVSAGLAAAPGTYNLAAGGAAANATLNTTITHLTDVSGALGGANTLTLIRGTYTAGTNTFVGSATGADTLAVLDTASNAATTAYEAVVLVGYADTSTATVAAAGLITL